VTDIHRENCETSFKTDEGSFPWFIAQVETLGDEETCWAQAVTSATAALKMYENVSRYVEDRADQQHVPPVVMLTAVGASVKVWLAFSHTKPYSDEPTTVSMLIYGSWAQQLTF
jgi:hypothetical protein